MAEAETPCCISHVFERAARRDPDRLAVVHAASSDGGGEGRRFTCGDLLAAVGSLSRRIAAALAELPYDCGRPGSARALGCCFRSPL
jgi:acyl-CoA synthetase